MVKLTHEFYENNCPTNINGFTVLMDYRFTQWIIQIE